LAALAGTCAINFVVQSINQFIEQGYWHPDVKKRAELLRYKREEYKEQVLNWIVDKQSFSSEELKLLKQVGTHP